MNKTIIIIEDDDILRKSLVFFLQRNDYKIIEFDNGLDALEYFKEGDKEIDLVITDLNLPFAGGRQVLLYCKNENNQNIPVLVLTSNSIEETEVELLDMGADDFVPKPFSPKVLLRKIQRIIK